MMKGKQIEACTEGSKLEASTEGSKLEASTRKEAEAAETSIAAPEASNELYWLPLLAYMHSCVHVRAFPRTSTKYVVLRLLNKQTQGGRSLLVGGRRRQASL